MEVDGAQGVDLRPMVRARLVAIDGQPPPAPATERARRFLERENNLSWRADPEPYNRLAAGRWWSADRRGAQISLEQEWAKTLGVRLGSRLTFEVSGQQVTGTVTSLREVNWESLRSNFFVLFSPGALDQLPATYITAYRVEPARADRPEADCGARWPSLEPRARVMPIARALAERAPRREARRQLDRSLASIAAARSARPTEERILAGGHPGLDLHERAYLGAALHLDLRGVRLAGWLGLLIVALPLAVILAWRPPRRAWLGHGLVAALAVLASLGVTPEWTYAEPGRFLPLAVATVLGLLLLALGALRWSDQDRDDPSPDSPALPTPAPAYPSGIRSAGRRSRWSTRSPG